MFNIATLSNRIFRPSGSNLIRGGIIPYTFISKNDIQIPIFCFGIDSYSADLTDFGGSRNSGDRDIIDTAIREFNEETLGVFGEIKIENIIGSKIIYDDHNAIILVYLDLNIEDIEIINQNFISLSTNHPNIEISSLVWLTNDQINIGINLNNRIIKGFNPFVFYYPIFKLLDQAKFLFDKI